MEVLRLSLVVRAALLCSGGLSQRSLVAEHGSRRRASAVAAWA